MTRRALIVRRLPPCYKCCEPTDTVYEIAGAPFCHPCYREILKGRDIDIEEAITALDPDAVTQEIALEVSE